MVAEIGQGWSEISSQGKGLDFCMIISIKVCARVRVHVSVCVYLSHACAVLEQGTGLWQQWCHMGRCVSWSPCLPLITCLCVSLSLCVCLSRSHILNPRRRVLKECL